MIWRRFIPVAAGIAVAGLVNMASPASAAPAPVHRQPAKPKVVVIGQLCIPASSGKWCLNVPGGKLEEDGRLQLWRIGQKQNNFAFTQLGDVHAGSAPGPFLYNGFDQNYDGTPYGLIQYVGTARGPQDWCASGTTWDTNTQRGFVQLLSCTWTDNQDSMLWVWDRSNNQFINVDATNNSGVTSNPPSYGAFSLGNGGTPWTCRPGKCYYQPEWFPRW